MPMINQQSMYRINNQKLNLKKESISFENYILKNRLGYYIGVRHEVSINHIIKIIPSSVLNLIKQNKIYLLISNEQESLIGCIKLIYEELIIKHKIPDDKIIYISGTIDVKDEILLISKIFNKKPIESYFYSYWEKCAHDYLNNNNFNKTQNLKSKIYLCLNRKWRLHRPFLISLLYSYNLEKHGHISLGKNEWHNSWNEMYNILLEMLQNNKCLQFYEFLKQHKHKILRIPELYLDTSNLDDPNIYDGKKMINKESIQYFKDAYFSVVTETNYFEDIIFLTEKTFKPLVMKQPFILVSSPNTLVFLKSLGYKTFSSIINEEYDQEKDHFTRMKLIVEEIDNLCKLSYAQLDNLIDSINDVLEHNFNHLKNKVNIEDYIYKLI